MNKFKQRLLKLLPIPCFLFGCASSVESEEILLTMAWKAGPPTSHVVSLELNLLADISADKGQSHAIETSQKYETSFTQTVSDHPDGILVSFTDIEVAEPGSTIGGMETSPMQQMILKMTSLGLASKPDYIMSSNGEFVRLHKIEQYETAHRERIKNIFGADLDKLGSMGTAMKSISEGLLNRELLEKKVRDDIRLLKDWDAMTFKLKKPIEKVITPAYRGKNNSDTMAEGKLSYHGDVKCKFATQVTCVELRFESKDKDAYNVKIVAEPGTLIPHEYRAESKIELETELKGSAITNRSSVEYVHRIRAF